MFSLIKWFCSLAICFSVLGSQAFAETSNVDQPTEIGELVTLPAGVSLGQACQSLAESGEATVNRCRMPGFRCSRDRECCSGVCEINHCGDMSH